MTRCRILTLFTALWLSATAQAADLAALSAQTWDRYAPEGKEVDAIHGDLVLANRHVVAVIAKPRRGRHANMTVRNVGGCVIDLTQRQRSNDQLSAFYPGASLRELNFAGVDVESPTTYEATELERLFVQGRQVTLRLVASPREREPDVQVAYTLHDDWDHVKVTTTYSNRGAEAVVVEPVDAVRADKTFEFSPESGSEIFSAYDRAFDQAYAILPEGRGVISSAARLRLIRYPDRDGKVALRLEPGQSFQFTRHLLVGPHLFDVQQRANVLTGKTVRSVTLQVVDTSGTPVIGAEVVHEADGKKHAWGRTGADGMLIFDAGNSPGTITIASLGSGARSVSIDGSSPSAIKVELPRPGTVRAAINDSQGSGTPCKVQFVGKEGTATPDFGPASGAPAVKNIYYSHDGRFSQALEPGTYDVIISHGPEFNAVFTTITISQGQESRLEAILDRPVKTDGWISTDFHSHSSPSGDNTSSQRGRVLNLLCENIEFAPCTEHNRISTYDPHLRALNAVGRMATCSGMELTGTPLPLNHQNAFPLVMNPRTQDNGSPTTDEDPATQIARLALWDQGSEKLVQVNHPDLGWMFHDRNGDGKPDAGFAGMFGHIDVLEVHPPHSIFGAPTTTNSQGTVHNNTIHNWLQLLNLGKTYPGVVNTDAHENFHGSGWLRNFVKSPTDDPADIQTMDVVHATERGHVVMSTGPFLEVSLRSEDINAPIAGPGDRLALPGGKGRLKIRVQCPNWFDVDRVQVFVNGRPVDRLNFTRKTSSDQFMTTTTKFDQEIPIELTSDTHIIVGAIGEESRLGPVMGPDHGTDLPVAVSNPIYVDVDGNGFKPNGDHLGLLPVKGQ